MPTIFPFCVITVTFGSKNKVSINEISRSVNTLSQTVVYIETFFSSSDLDCESSAQFSLLLVPQLVKSIIVSTTNIFLISVKFLIQFKYIDFILKAILFIFECHCEILYEKTTLTLGFIHLRL